MLYLSGTKVIKSFYNTLSNPEYKNKFIFEALNDIAPKHPLKIIKLEFPVRKINNIKIFKRIQNR